MSLNLNIQKSTPARKTKVYPTLTLTGHQAELVDQSVSLAQTIESAKGQMAEIDNALKDKAVAQFFKIHHGHTEIPSTMRVEGNQHAGKITFKNAYPMVDPEDEARITELELLTGMSKEELLTDKWEVKVDGSKVPSHKAEQFCQELAALCAQYGCSDALSLKHGLVAVTGFHETRHTTLSPGANLELQGVMPMQIAFSKKG